MNLAYKAYYLLYKKNPEYSIKLSYTNRFKDFGANIRHVGNLLEFRLSKRWQNKAEEIQIGLMQELLIKLFKQRKETMYIELYNKFLKKLHTGIPKTRTEPELESAFIRVNNEYFFGTIEQPNLCLSNSRAKLGSYDYKTDTITISRLFKNADQRLLDFIMYHEILHKAHSFKNKAGRNIFHDKQFKAKEKRFKNYAETDKQLKLFLKRSKNRAFALS